MNKITCVYEGKYYSNLEDCIIRGVLGLVKTDKDSNEIILNEVKNILTNPDGFVKTKCTDLITNVIYGILININAIRNYPTTVTCFGQELLAYTEMILSSLNKTKKVEE